MDGSGFLCVSDTHCLPRTLFPEVQLIQHARMWPLGCLDFIKSSFQGRSLGFRLCKQAREAPWLGPWRSSLLGIWTRKGGLQQTCSPTFRGVRAFCHFITKRGATSLPCAGHSRLVLIAVSPSHVLFLALRPPCLPHLSPHSAALSSSLWLSQVWLALGSGVRGLCMSMASCVPLS